MKNKTKKLTVSAVISALSVVLLLAGSVIDVLDLSVAAIASFAVIFAILELGGAYPVLIYSSTAILGMLLLPSKLPALYYLLFFGWYPIAKFALERLNVWVCRILKATLATVSAAAMLLIGGMLIGADGIPYQQIWVYALLIPVFAIYDVGLTRITRAYLVVWKRKYKIDLERR